MSKLLVGADPEFFVEDMQGNLKSIIGHLGGTKENPIPVKELGKGYAYQEDNVLAEYNIPPAETEKAFFNFHTKMIRFLTDKLAEKGLRPRWTASEIMPEMEMADPHAWVFGCEPDYNVWSLEINPRPNAENPLLRSGGGHVHVGYRMTNAMKILTARWVDANLGLWSVIHDPDTRRRELYGKAGAIRFKPYGFEYRTLSNFWVREKAQSVWSRVSYAIKLARDSKTDLGKYAKDIQKAINTSDKNLAKNLLHDLGLE